MTPLLGLVLLASLNTEPPAPPVSAAPGQSRVEPVVTTGSVPVNPARPENKTLVASLDTEQGAGKDRISLYQDGTLVLVKTYEEVRKVKKKILAAEEVDIIRRVCKEAVSLDVVDYKVDVLGRSEPRRFRIEIGRDNGGLKVFQFDELARVPLVLGRAKGALEGLLERFDETTVSQDDIWDPSKLRRGDVLTHRKDGMQYRIDRDDIFVRSLELVEVARSLQRLIILREDVPKLFLNPSPEEANGEQR